MSSEEKDKKGGTEEKKISTPKEAINKLFYLLLWNDSNGYIYVAYIIILWFITITITITITIHLTVMDENFRV